jgi:plastocyanin
MRTSILFGMRSIIFLGFIAFMPIGGLIASSIAEAKEIRIFINSLSFLPQAIHADAGDRITWTNNDGVRHEIFFSRNPTNSGDQHLRYQLRSNQSVSIIVTKPGDYDYRCRWHGMWGSIHVDQKSQP